MPEVKAICCEWLEENLEENLTAGGKDEENSEVNLAVGSEDEENEEGHLSAGVKDTEEATSITRWLKLVEQPTFAFLKPICTSWLSSNIKTCLTERNVYSWVKRAQDNQWDGILAAVLAWLAECHKKHRECLTRALTRDKELEMRVRDLEMKEAKENGAREKEVEAKTASLASKEEVLMLREKEVVAATASFARKATELLQREKEVGEKEIAAKTASLASKEKELVQREEIVSGFEHRLKSQRNQLKANAAKELGGVRQEAAAKLGAVLEACKAYGVPAGTLDACMAKCSDAGVLKKQAAPQAAPQAVPQAAPQVAPQAVPKAAPQAVPQAVSIESRLKSQRNQLKANAAKELGDVRQEAAAKLGAVLEACKAYGVPAGTLDACMAKCSDAGVLKKGSSSPSSSPSCSQSSSPSCSPSCSPSSSPSCSQSSSSFT
eukprot:gene25334-10991_t